MMTENNKPKPFMIKFDNDYFSPAVHVPPSMPPKYIVEVFGLITPKPVIFLTGGASAMSEDDIMKTRHIMGDGIASFAEEHNITVVDGGTEAGIMQMIGNVRKERGYKFPLIGVAPHGLVSYPGHKNPNEQAFLEDGHSHFVLVDGNEWGGESQMITDLTRSIAAYQQPMIGILINGGKIAQRDVYLATASAQPKDKIPILVLDGSGRAADDLTKLLTTNLKLDSTLLRKIANSGGNIQITHIDDGVPGILKVLRKHFNVETTTTPQVKRQKPQLPHNPFKST